MKNSIIYLVLIVLLAGIAFFVVNRNTSSTIDPAEKEFAFRDVQNVDRIILTNKADVKAELKLDNGVWMINDKYEARRPAVNTLLNTFKRMTPLYPVSKAAHDEVVRNILGKSVRVELYEKNKAKPSKVVHVGGGTVNNDGTYMILENNNRMAERPYIVSVPKFEGYLTSRFFTDEEEWRSTEVIRYQPEEIQEVEVDYPNFPEYSFGISRNRAGNLEFSPPNAGQVRTELLTSYLELLQSRSIEAFQNDYSKIDSIKMQTPFCNLSITDIKGKKNNFYVYYKPVNERTKFTFDDNNNPMQYDVDRYFVSFNDGKDFGVLQYYVFGSLFRKKKDFLIF